MPYCCQCGTVVGAADKFCARCGARQQSSQAAGTGPGSGAPGGAAPTQDFFGGMNPRTVSLLCYIPFVGWLAAIAVIATQRFRHDHDTRFHAFQGLYLFVAWLIVRVVVLPSLSFTDAGGAFPLPRAAAGILQLLILVAWIVMIIKVNRNEHYRLPIVGELAERSVTEQGL